MDEQAYKDADLVYVDPRTRTVIGKVEWSASGRPKSLPMKDDEVVEGDDGKRHRRRRYYPWGTFRSMRRLYKIDGWRDTGDRQIPLEKAIEKAMNEPFWDDPPTVTAS